MLKLWYFMTKLLLLTQNTPVRARQGPIITVDGSMHRLNSLSKLTTGWTFVATQWYRTHLMIQRLWVQIPVGAGLFFSYLYLIQVPR